MDKHYTTHSFFNYIFVQKSVFIKNKYKEVLLHEQFHADHWHSFDLLFIGILSILQWFNPFIYLFKRALVETHEFQADRAIIDNGIDKLYYQQLLLKQARSVVFAGLTSNFNQSLIKNRFKMMNKIKSSNKVMYKYLLVFPVVFFVGIFFAISQEKINDSIVEVIISDEGESIIGISDFAIVDMPEDDRINVYADELFASDPLVVRMEGNVKLETFNKKISVNAANILINKKERKLYAFTDDYIPSISPLDEKSTFKITSGFGMRMHPVLKKEMMHNGMDFSAETGTPVYATANGSVREAFHDKNYGNRIIIDHSNGFSTSYSQLQKFGVKKSQSVKQGEIIGYVGSSGLSTGSHLHYEIMKDGKYVDPKDYLNIETE
jgi:murein DD-endopeptidase MepM/ murein hydrolase activator NlpD